jgi:hypothetical protein
VAFVKSAGREVGFAEFQEYPCDGGGAEFVEGGEQERGGYTFAAEIAVHGDIEDFRFVSNLARCDEADDLGMCLTNKEDAAW